MKGWSGGRGHRDGPDGHGLVGGLVGDGLPACGKQLGVPAEISEIESSYATHGASDTADAICIPYVKFNLTPENSQGKATDLRCAASRSLVLPWLFFEVRLNFTKGMRMASAVSKAPCVARLVSVSEISAAAHGLQLGMKDGVPGEVNVVVPT